MRNTSKKSTLPHNIRWGQLNWLQIKRYVERMQQRIYRAESLGNKRKVRNLQRILIRSKSVLLLAIKRVTQANKGKKTAGIDGETALTGTERIELYKAMAGKNIWNHRPKPSRRTYIKKKNGKLRPLSIPTIKDRIYQSIIKCALEPQWEARFESSSYGFRPKRGCHDALKRIFLSCWSGNKQWIFEGDFKGCFDSLNHEYIMEQIKGFPYRNTVERWLKAGFVDNGVFSETGSGSGQGSIVSPLLANIALSGMEEVLDIKYKPISRKGRVIGYENISKYTLVFYADDFVIICNNEKDAEEIYDRLQPYLKSRGLTLSEEKTKVTNVKKGFDFLGFNVRMYKTSQKDKLLIKPSKDSVKKARGTISQEVKNLYGSNISALVSRLNSIITGTANYWSPWVSKLTYERIDQHTFGTIIHFLRNLHPKKSMKWMRQKYFKPDKAGQSKDRWILTEPNEGRQLAKMAWTPIIRHPLIKFKASPYDTDLKEYFEERDRKEFNRNCVKSRQKLAKRQNYKCPICEMSITNFHEKLTVIEKSSDNRKYENLELVHKICQKYRDKMIPSSNLLSPKEVKECYKEIKRMRLAEVVV